MNRRRPARLIDVYQRLRRRRGCPFPPGSCGRPSASAGSTLGRRRRDGGPPAYGIDLRRRAPPPRPWPPPTAGNRTVDAVREPDLFWALARRRRRPGSGSFTPVADGGNLPGAATAGSFVLTYPWTVAARVAAGWQAHPVGRAPTRPGRPAQFRRPNSGGRQDRPRLRLRPRRGRARPRWARDPQPRDRVRSRAAAKIDRRPLPGRGARTGPVATRPATCGARSTELVGSDVFRHPLARPRRFGRAAGHPSKRRAAQRRFGVAKFKRMDRRAGPGSRPAPHRVFPWRGAHTMLQWLVQPVTGRTPATTRDGVRGGSTSGHRAVGAVVGRPLPSTTWKPNPGRACRPVLRPRTWPGSGGVRAGRGPGPGSSDRRYAV